MPCALGSYTRMFAKFVHMCTSSFRLREHKPQFFHLGLDVFFSFKDHENDNVHMCTNSTFWSSMVGNVALIGSQEWHSYWSLASILSRRTQAWIFHIIKNLHFRHRRMPCTLSSCTWLFAKFVHMCTSWHRLIDHSSTFFPLGSGSLFSFNAFKNDSVHMCTNSTFWSSMVSTFALICSKGWRVYWSLGRILQRRTWVWIVHENRDV